MGEWISPQVLLPAPCGLLPERCARLDGSIVYVAADGKPCDARALCDPASFKRQPFFVLRWISCKALYPHLNEFQRLRVSLPVYV